MQPAGLDRLASSVVVLPASPKLGAVKRTFLLCSKGTLSLCCHRYRPANAAVRHHSRSSVGIARFQYHGRVTGENDLPAGAANNGFGLDPDPRGEPKDDQRYYR